MPRDPDHRGSRKGLLFAASLALAQVLMLAFCFWAAGQPWIVDHDGDPMFRAVGFAQRAAGMNCQVVLYGDSTALADFDRDEMERRTGLKSCNISEFRLIEDFMGTDFILDSYLAHNARPRFIVTGWTPATLDLGHARMIDLSSEDFLYAMHYSRGPWLWKGMLRHPGATLEFLTWVERVLLEDQVMRLKGQRASMWARDERDVRDSQGGTWAIQKPAQTACRGSAVHFRLSTRQENAEGIEAFRRKYQKDGTTVLVDATPVAECDPHVPEYVRRSGGLTDNALEVLPIGSFNDGDIHLGPDAAKAFSAKVAAQILNAAGRPADAAAASAGGGSRP